MNEFEKTKLLEVRLRSKRGGVLDERDQKFCVEMFEKDPKGYKELNEEVNKIIAEEFRF